ncbi:hypothetical protein CORC01_10804 [Colletotrichum orchidophilum]|uniref:Uncharacterized protein n=1 Tax=Colletotrichum orchidophilum TaxID=1209926 RepID=A0A1G4AXR3_9PEZI|nr:uncharacterized protein CORC01_10804 [Colletotrichum orchidophilum]OHE93905.1 hypothetical protein CORC01_10804 [Colletotrichum orchidophilum]
MQERHDVYEMVHGAYCSPEAGLPAGWWRKPKDLPKQYPLMMSAVEQVYALQHRTGRTSGRRETCRIASWTIRSSFCLCVRGKRPSTADLRER